AQDEDVNRVDVMVAVLVSQHGCVRLVVVHDIDKVRERPSGRVGETVYPHVILIDVRSVGRIVVAYEVVQRPLQEHDG
ncbi:MAG: hypothetical protein IJT72_04420, partial [Lachnospiraceae bacterium]|nr:hypothetical protein [Lachnospiraceae bacterium]